MQFGLSECGLFDRLLNAGAFKRQQDKTDLARKVRQINEVAAVFETFLVSIEDDLFGKKEGRVLIVAEAGVCGQFLFFFLFFFCG